LLSRQLRNELEDSFTFQVKSLEAKIENSLQAKEMESKFSED